MAEVAVRPGGGGGPGSSSSSSTTTAAAALNHFPVVSAAAQGPAQSDSEAVVAADSNGVVGQEAGDAQQLRAAEPACPAEKATGSEQVETDGSPGPHASIPKSSLYSSLQSAAVAAGGQAATGSPPPALLVGGPESPVDGPACPAAVYPAPTGGLRHGLGSLSSLGPGPAGYGYGFGFSNRKPALDSMSYLESASMISGTLESLGPGLGDDVSSLGSDSEVNGMGFRKTDKYGFLGGSQFTGNSDGSIPVEVARQREMKWLDMLAHWDKWVYHRFQKVKLRCRKGIPSSLRAKAWQQLSNSKELMEQNPGKFDDLERQPGDPKWLDIIEKDLHRQFPFHEMFAARGGHGQQDLYRILKAYTIYRPEEGYCQAQAPVAAVLLMHMPAEQAFWCLVQICEKYLPGYYSAGLEAIQLDGEIFFALLRKVSSMAYRHLKKYKIDPILYMTEWFMCVFSRTLPWSSVLRVWDMFFAEGVKIIFRVGLVLLRSTLGSVDKLRDCQGMYETMEKLRNIPHQYMQEELLIQEVCALQVTEALIERENKIQLKKWRENRGELQHRPVRRLYGSRAVYEEGRRMNPLVSSSVSLLSLTSLKRIKEEKRKLPKDQRGSPAHHVSSLAATAGPTPPATLPTVTMELSDALQPSKAEKQKEKEAAAAVVTQKKQKKVPPELPEQPSQVVSEGLHASLPSPTANVTPLGGPVGKRTKEEKRREKEEEKQRAKEREREEKEKQRQEKEKQRQEKEKQKQEKKKAMKEKAKEEAAKQKRERKGSKRGDAQGGGGGVSASKDEAKVPKTAENKKNGAGNAKDGLEKGVLQAVEETAPVEAPAMGGASSNRDSAGNFQDTYF
ncbi:TBC1 domain family member 10A [Latimeria chalumnae]|uniref:TBC1 domain family member 10A n=1 Tax=Latimeria chalumnae TaxID=7897 RepID=UPI0006D917F8|nr:PREDICTED: TBC1 domain family member 10B [Latimeria chalumnae]|eukprot:XP_006009092.2 PREDICTED: TBC1 domain family member 10B [Latimeria chalumnae]